MSLAYIVLRTNFQYDDYSYYVDEDNPIGNVIHGYTEYEDAVFCKNNLTLSTIQTEVGVKEIFSFDLEDIKYAPNFHESYPSKFNQNSHEFTEQEIFQIFYKYGINLSKNEYKIIKDNIDNHNNFNFVKHIGIYYCHKMTRDNAIKFLNDFVPEIRHPFFITPIDMD